MTRKQNRIGRNEQCWCGSGKKYKRCHYGRESATETNVYELEDIAAENFSAEYCLHPEAGSGQCKGKIIRAHSIQRAGVLNAVAENGHVNGYCFRLNLLMKNNGIIPRQSVGINNASIFRGFCEYHDNQTFAPIERRLFSGTNQQCFLHSYRALCREIYTRRAALKSIELVREMDRGTSIQNQLQIQKLVAIQKRGLRKGLDGLEIVKRIFDIRLLNKTYDDISHCIFFFDKVPEIVCSGGFFPERDLHGRQLQVLSDSGQLFDIVFLTVLAVESQGAAIFTWVGNTESPSLNFVKSICDLERDKIPNVIGRIAIGHIENTFSNPSWWKALSTPERNFIERFAASGAPIPDINFSAAKHEISYISSRIVRIQTNPPQLSINSDSGLEL
jgi:hypothetical protein